MMENRPVKPKANKTDVSGAKRLILTLAVTSSLGFWALFSQLNRDAAAAQLEPEPKELVLDLPPMPTLLPPLDPAQAPITTVSEVSPVSTNTAVSSPISGKIYLGGSKPGSATKPATRRAPVTKTRSSK